VPEKATIKVEFWARSALSAGVDGDTVWRASKAKEKLGREPEILSEEACTEMVAMDVHNANRHALLRRNGYDTPIAVNH
jgi:hypothetical protein